MDAAERKAAIRAYKERKIAGGIFALRCTATGQQWVGRAVDIGAIHNRLCFTLDLGSHPQQKLQAAWREHGAEAFVFDELERLKDDLAPYERDKLLAKRLEHWVTATGAMAIR